MSNGSASPLLVKLPSYVEQPGAPYRPAWVPGHLSDGQKEATWVYQIFFGSDTVSFFGNQYIYIYMHTYHDDYVYVYIYTWKKYMSF